MERYTWVRFAGKLTSCQTMHIATVSISAGRWNVTCGGSIRHITHIALPQHTTTVSIPVGQWMKCRDIHWAHSNCQHFSGAMDESSGKVQAHIRSGVVMDITAFKVSLSKGIDKDATPLRAARARSSSIGAVDESSRNVQNANAHLD